MGSCCSKEREGTRGEHPQDDQKSTLNPMPSLRLAPDQKEEDTQEEMDDALLDSGPGQVIKKQKSGQKDIDDFLTHSDEEDAEPTRTLQTTQPVAAPSTPPSQRLEGSPAQAVTQLAASLAATATIEAIHAVAEEASDALKGKVGDYWRHRSRGIEDLMDNTELIDAQYLLALAGVRGVVPRCQDIPTAAKITKPNLWRLRICENKFLPVLILSYCWYSKEHPDPLGLQLQRLVPILKTLLSTVQKKAGPECTIGVLWDYCSYPQYPRTEEESERFIRGLRTINQWYMHPFTKVLMLNNTPENLPEHTNQRTYDERGWTYFERSAAAIVKHRSSLWEYSRYRGSTEFSTMSEQMIAHRHPVVSPDRFSSDLRQGVESGALRFTASADLDFVTELYQSGFILAFETFRRTAMNKGIVTYGGLQWNDQEAQLIAETMAYVIAHCDIQNGNELTIWLGGNNFTEAGVLLMKNTVANSPQVQVDLQKF